MNTYLKQFKDMLNPLETKQELETLQNNNIINDNNTSQQFEAEFKDIPDLNRDFAIDSMLATYRLVFVEKALKGSQLSYSLHLGQIEYLKKHTEQHIKGVAILAKINENIKLLQDEEKNLKAKLLEFENHYKKTLKLHDIDNLEKGINV